MIELQNVTKKYNNFKAVSDVSFKIEDGEVVGFLGPNGAGKSTTMNMITGYIEPTKGKISVNGYDISQKARKAKKLIGYMPENVPLYPELTVKEFVTYMAELKLIKRREKKEAVEKAIKVTGLSEVSGKLIINLSRGYKQRVSLAGALVGNPPILILDEPTVGLDPKQVHEIRELIKKLGKDHTILVSSHILSEINQMCNKIIIIDHGKILRIDKTENIENETQKKISEITIEVEEEKASFKEIKKQIPEITKIELISEDKNPKTYTVNYNSDEDIRKKIFKACVEKDITIVEMKKKEVTLEDAFLDITSQGIKYDKTTAKEEKAETKTEKTKKEENKKSHSKIEKIKEKVKKEKKSDSEKAKKGGKK